MNVRNERVEILVEEPSMEVVLRHLLPRILPLGYVLDENVFIRPHQGKQDLQRSIPRKVRVFSHFHQPAKLIIVHDQDSHDCMRLKAELRDLCQAHGTCPVLIRIACRELENWYLGDPDALEQVYPAFKAETHRHKRMFRQPDSVQGADVLTRLIAGFQKGDCARRIGPFLAIDTNQSPSFQQLVAGIRAFLPPA